MVKQENLLKKLREHQPIIVNYGKSEFEDRDIKELATWDKKRNAYVSETGIWDTKLLIEIARGEVENTTIEIGE